MLLFRVLDIFNMIHIFRLLSFERLYLLIFLNLLHELLINLLFFNFLNHFMGGFIICFNLDVTLMIDARLKLIFMVIFHFNLSCLIYTTFLVDYLIVFLLYLLFLTFC
jgi:hypothetical protein